MPVVMTVDRYYEFNIIGVSFTFPTLIRLNLILQSVQEARHEVNVLDLSPTETMSQSLREHNVRACNRCDSELPPENLFPQRTFGLQTAYVLWTSSQA